MVDDSLKTMDVFSISFFVTAVSVFIALIAAS